MKSVLFIFFVFLTHIANGQTISTYAGSIGIYNPNGLAFDQNGNLYVTSPLGYKIWKVDTFGVSSTVAGTGVSGFSGDNGPATLAILNQPGGIAIDPLGNILFADAGNNRIRKINATTGTITTIIGTGTAGFSGDGGPASTSLLNSPTAICLDNSGSIYIADNGNMRIRKVNTSGIISTFAGNGTLGYAGDGGPATAAQCYPSGITTDNSGNFYVSNFSVVGSSCKIRKVNSSGIISTIAGDTALCAYNGDAIPASSAHIGVTYMTMHNGLLYVTDGCNKRVRYIDHSGIIRTIAGNGTHLYSGDGGPATAAGIYGPSGIAFDKCGNLYIGQVNNPRIRKVTFNPPPCNYLNVGQLANVSQETSIYPNPVTDELHIEGLTTRSEYMLLNVTGIIEQKGVLQPGSNTIRINALPAGLHLLLITGEDGKRTMYKTIKQ